MVQITFMNIRTIQEQDAAAVFAFGNKVLAHHNGFDTFYKVVEASNLKQSESEKIGFIAFENEMPIGYVIGIYIQSPADRSVPFAILQSVWVEEFARGRGVAQQLVAEFEKNVKEKGAKQIDLNVDIRNVSGLQLWDAGGYETYQERRRKFL